MGLPRCFRCVESPACLIPTLYLVWFLRYQCSYGQTKRRTWLDRLGCYDLILTRKRFLLSVTYFHTNLIILQDVYYSACYILSDKSYNFPRCLLLAFNKFLKFELKFWYLYTYIPNSICKTTSGWTRLGVVIKCVWPPKCH